MSNQSEPKMFFFIELKGCFYGCIIGCLSTYLLSKQKYYIHVVFFVILLLTYLLFISNIDILTYFTFSYIKIEKNLIRTLEDPTF